MLPFWRQSKASSIMKKACSLGRYGQTSSGKSYSMGTTGDEADYSGTTFTTRTGVIARAFQAILDGAEEARLSAGPGSS